MAEGTKAPTCCCRSSRRNRVGRGAGEQIAGSGGAEERGSRGRGNIPSKPKRSEGCIEGCGGAGARSSTPPSKPLRPLKGVKPLIVRAGITETGRDLSPQATCQRSHFFLSVIPPRRDERTVVGAGTVGLGLVAPISWICLASSSYSFFDFSIFGLDLFGDRDLRVPTSFRKYDNTRLLFAALLCPRIQFWIVYTIFALAKSSKKTFCVSDNIINWLVGLLAFTFALASSRLNPSAR